MGGVGAILPPKSVYLKNLPLIGSLLALMKRKVAIWPISFDKMQGEGHPVDGCVGDAVLARKGMVGVCAK